MTSIQLLASAATGGMLCALASASSWSDGRLSIDGHRLQLSTIHTPEQCDIDPATGIGGEERHALHSHLHRIRSSWSDGRLSIDGHRLQLSIIHTPEQCDIDPATGIGGDERHALHSHLHRI